MPNLPFLKEKPPIEQHVRRVLPVATLHALNAKHNVYSPFCVAQFPKKPLDIKMPWLISTPISLIEDRIAEYKELFPMAGHPSNQDLIMWLYNRARDAENNFMAADGEVERLEQQVKDLETDARIRSASHGV